MPSLIWQTCGSTARAPPSSSSSIRVVPSLAPSPPARGTSRRTILARVRPDPHPHPNPIWHVATLNGTWHVSSHSSGTG
eukprot:680346-Prymnesium_polylepis.1